ncbi:hypothetical protein [Granulicella sp. dw_53]|uniref:hypothetical protein n=1 Tax=Granulicella sp. dw_53 TaxID=2719792 RepID=UPI001BD3C597|nr:hypothetical protein [Granulicella sp. dw_53]
MKKFILFSLSLILVGEAQARISGSPSGALPNSMYAGAQFRDIGAEVNDEIALLPTVTQNGQTWAQGTVNIPVGNYAQTTTILIASPFVNLRCEPGTILTFMGAGDAVRILPSAQITGLAQTQPNQGPSVQNCSFYNVSPTATSAIHAGDISQIHISNVAVNNFNGTPTSAGYWFDNTVSFTEGMALNDIASNNNSIGMRFTNTAGGVLTQSFGYASIRGFRAQVRTNQIGISVETGTFLYHSFIDAIMETSDPTGTAMSVTGTGKVGGNSGDDVVFLRGECVNTSGPCSGSTLLNLGAAAQFVANGFMNGLGSTMTNIIAPGAVLTWNGTTEINQSTFNFGWSSDNSILMRFASTPAVAIFSNNMRLGGSYVLGWSTGPTTAANYVGLSPCVFGAATLCVGNGVISDASAGVTAGTFTGSQFVGNSPSPLISAGPAAGIQPENVTLAPGSTNVSGTIVFKTGSSPAAGATVATITFATPLAQPPNVCIASALNTSTAAALKSLFIPQPTATGFVLASGQIPLNPATAFLVGYACF